MEAKKNILSALVALSLCSCLSHNERVVSNFESSPAIALDESILEEENQGPSLDLGEEAFYKQEEYQFSPPIETASQEYSVYTTKGSETLMLIGFEAYSDYRTWKKILGANKDILEGVPDSLPPGIKLKLPHPINPFTPSRGRPYLIKEKDTLSKISKKVYGTWKLWPEIYENNKKQIRFPDLIFAGFTLFYPTEPLQQMGMQPH